MSMRSKISYNEVPRMPFATDCEVKSQAPVFDWHPKWHWVSQIVICWMLMEGKLTKNEEQMPHV